MNQSLSVKRRLLLLTFIYGLLFLFPAFAKCLTIVLVFSIAGSYLAFNRWLRYPSTGIAVLALVVWVLAGLMKVVSQLN